MTKIRPAVPADLPEIAGVHTRARGEAYKDLVPAEALHAIDASALAQWWEQRWGYERETHRLAVAQDPAGPLVGFTYVGPSDHPRTGELYAIHVDPDRQGDGIGRALMAAALTSLAGLGARRAVLWVLAGNERARRFYERGGWRDDHAERSAPVGPALTRQVRYWHPLG
ncbi:MAG TPA: GNAT family N-acetyltransferase [Micromonosporaceae bacterium]|nr:GNAT family N-acetyltransferase [Micromonosporaceae bacterium]